MLVEEVAAPGFNALNLLLFPNFEAGSIQDSPSTLPMVGDLALVILIH